jgi:hypothetical protein
MIDYLVDGKGVLETRAKAVYEIFEKYLSL